MRKDGPLILQRKRELVAAAIKGKSSASSAALFRSFGLPFEDIARILKNNGVLDDG